MLCATMPVTTNKRGAVVVVVVTGPLKRRRVDEGDADDGHTPADDATAAEAAVVGAGETGPDGT
jgi:hypothetical protein